MATKKKISKFHPAAGISLIELLVGLGISTVVILACYDIVNKSSQNYATIAAASENIVETLEASTALKRKISFAVNLVSEPGPIANNLRLTKSQIISYDLAAWVPTTGDGRVDLVFSGFIDSLKSNYPVLPARFDRFVPMAIYFQRPTVNKFGVIYMTLGNADTTFLRPRDANFIFRQIVDFKIKNIDITNSSLDRVSKFDLEITRRSFKQTTNNYKYTWCPPEKMTLPDCASAPAFTDSTEYTTVVLRNNVLEKNSQQQKIAKPLGSVPNYVGIPKRMTSGVYYLDSVQPAESTKR